jgi:hypothetical protein
MNYLTNYYKNLSEQLQAKVNLLESHARQLNQLNEAPEAYEMADGYGTQTAPYSGAYLGQLLGQGNMANVYDYLNQYGMGTVPGGMSALTSGRRSVNRRGLESAGDGAPRGAGPGAFSGANLGQLLGQGNMNAVNQYLSQYGANGAYQAGQALRSSNRPSANRGGYENAGGGAPRGAGSAAFSGANLGQLLGQGNMNAVNNYLANYGNNGAYQAGQALRTANRPSSNRGGYEDAGSGVNPMAGDYNGDGRVDGADLGMALGSGQNSSGVINNWSSPYSAAGPAFLRTTPNSQGGGGVQVGGGYGEAPTPSVAGSAGGAAPRGGSRGRFGVAGPAGNGAPRGGFEVEGPAGGGAPSSGFGVAGPAGDAAPTSRFGTPELAGGPGGSGKPTSLPALTDLNGDGRIDGSDLGLYMIQYGAVPPGYGQQQTQPSFGQPGGYTPPGIGTYSPSSTTRPGAGSRRRQF